MPQTNAEETAECLVVGMVSVILKSSAMEHPTVLQAALLIAQQKMQPSLTQPIPYNLHLFLH
jgi:hypothetical protein